MSRSRGFRTPRCYVRRRRMRLSKNKRTRTLLQRKGKKQSKLIKLHNLGAQPTPVLDLGPHVDRLRHQRPPGLCRNVAGVRSQSVRVWVLGVLLCPAAKGQNIGWMRSGWVRGVRWWWGVEVVVDGRSDSLWRVDAVRNTGVKKCCFRCNKSVF